MNGITREKANGTLHVLNAIIKTKYVNRFLEVSVGNNMGKLDESDLKKLIDLHQRATNTPCIKLSSNPNEKDFATLAWDDVRDFQIELGKKYGYDWQKVAINHQ